MILGLEIFLILLGIVFIDSRLHKIRRIELEVLKELQLVNGSQREIAAFSNPSPSRRQEIDCKMQSNSR
jgi:hypothetical protein